ncbi:hypothetical protein BGY98DRAFT_938313 [Russula aff. rugulosa BPL654]|nr:hypothetical protein BGY98DRAFT_938313 [Russula aff. rugulosa BPL654]
MARVQPEKNYLPSPNGLFLLTKMGLPTLADVRRNFYLRYYVELAHYNDRPDEPDEQRYPFVITPANGIYSCVVELVLPPIVTIFQKVSISDMTLRDSRTTKVRKYLHLIAPTLAALTETASGSGVVAEAETCTVVQYDPKALLYFVSWYLKTLAIGIERHNEQTLKSSSPCPDVVSGTHFVTIPTKTRCCRMSDATNLSSSSTPSHCPEPASPAATEITYDISHDVEQLPEERIETLRAAGTKVRDFAYEPIPNSNKAQEGFDPMGWLTLTDVRRYFNPYDYVALAHYNDKPDEQRYPFVVASQNETIPTPSQRVRLRRQAGLATYPDDFPDKEFFGYNPTGYSDDEGEERGKEVLAAEAVAEAVVVEEPKLRRRKVKGMTKTRGRAKPKFCEGNAHVPNSSDGWFFVLADELHAASGLMSALYLNFGSGQIGVHNMGVLSRASATLKAAVAEGCVVP